MWWLSGQQDLHRNEGRLSTIYVERCHVDRDDNAVVLVNRARTVRVPAALVASMLLGPGTRITHGAVQLLGDSGTAVCWVGERGVRMYAAGLGASRGAQILMRQAYLVTRTKDRLDVARRMYGMRFPDEDVTTATMQQLRGREGARVKKIYRAESQRTGVPWTKRHYVHGETIGDDVNLMLSAGHNCLYGICHAAIVGLGASPALGFIHTGGATSFVLDIADLYKAEYTIPLAFDLVAAGQATATNARTQFRDKVADGRLMARIVRDIKELLGSDDDVAENDEHHLWDEKQGTVSSGVNWSNHPAGTWSDESFVAVTGPELESS